MTLSAHSRLGPYEILSPLGSGGMGEVYRAKDTRLERDVAVKVLPASFAGDPERLRRFELEARAAGALNHPNILAIHDIGVHEGATYLVTELLEGESLSERLAQGPLPLRKALDVAIQMAHGVAVAHEKGIIHRDLKPGNIFLTHDGRVKILDFGLAKLVTSESPDLSGTQTATRAADLNAQTEAGIVLGTVGYMSPEQVRGKPADARSDIFALGTILYEMLSGRRAFARDSSADTMAAILKEDPPELSGEAKNIPPGVERVVRHCLEKNPAERFQSARDFAFNLASLSGGSTTGVSALPATETASPRPAWGLPSHATLLFVLFVALLIGGIAGAFLARAFWPKAPSAGIVTFRPLNYASEAIFNARFAPDGVTVVFSSATEGNVPQLFVRRPDYPAPQSMGHADTELLSVSSQGELAVLTGARYQQHLIFNGTLARMALSGGAPREILQNVQNADWSPDGSALAIIREVGGQSRLEYPIGHVLYQTAGYVSDLRFSPRGDRISFFEHPFRYDDRGSLEVVDLGGHKKTLTEGYAGEEGMAWSADGGTIYFGAWSRNDPAFQIYAVTLAGQLRAVVASADNLWPFDRGSKGDLLASGNTWPMSLRMFAPGATAERDISWLDASNYPSISPNGREILFTDEAPALGENYALLLRQIDGSSAVRLGDGVAMGISPDGAWALSMLPNSPPRLVLYPTRAGEQKTLEPGPIERYEMAQFFPDGKRVLACGNESGHATRCYVQDIAGGLPRAVTPEGTNFGLVSPDGNSIFVQDADDHYIIYPVAGGPPQPVPWIAPDERALRWTADGRGIFVFHRSQVPAQVESVNLTTGKREQLAVLGKGERAGMIQILNATVSDDAKAYAYTCISNVSRLVIADGAK